MGEFGIKSLKNVHHGWGKNEKCFVKMTKCVKASKCVSLEQNSPCMETSLKIAYVKDLKLDNIKQKKLKIACGKA